MTPEQLRQRRRERDNKSIMKRLLIETEEMKRRTDEADSLYEHSRLQHEVEALKAQFTTAQAFSFLLGGAWHISETAAKWQQAKCRLEDHEYQMKYRGFAVPAQRN